MKSMNDHGCLNEHIRGKREGGFPINRRNSCFKLHHCSFIAS